MPLTHTLPIAFVAASAAASIALFPWWLAHRNDDDQEVD